MNEKDLRKIIEEVVAALAQKGYLSARSCARAVARSTRLLPEPGCGCAPAPESRGRGYTIQEDWRPLKKPGPSSPPPQSQVAAEEGEHTHCGACPHCEPVRALSETDLKALGLDRVAVCHPAKKGSSVARYVDHTLLKPSATQEEVAKLCEEAKAYCFASVCVNPSYVPVAARLLRGSGVKVCTVVGFPLGSTTATVKAIEARDAIANGADEIDMVINVGALKSGNDAAALADIQAVREATRGRVLKVILETSLLSKDEKTRACLLAKRAGADFVKTSTGFSGGGATAEDVRLMRETVGPRMGVKASGGIRDAQVAQAMIAAGATRLGTSASVAIVTGSSGAKGY